MSPGEQACHDRWAPGEREDDGATVVEFALVFTFLILPVMLAILQYGYQYWSLQTADATAREAARSLSVGTEWACTSTLAAGKIGGPAVGLGTPSVSMAYAGGVTAPRIGDVVEVHVVFQSLDIGFLPVPSGGVIDRTASARVENVPATPLSC